MALKNQALTVTYTAWDTAANGGKTGDVANHTLRLIQDGGTPVAPAATPTEVAGANTPGQYQVALATGEMNFNFVTLAGKSSTSGIVIFGVSITTERGVLPTVAPGAAAGLIVAGTGTNQLSLASGFVTLAAVTHTGAILPRVTLTDTATTVTNPVTTTTSDLVTTGTATAGSANTITLVSGTNIYKGDQIKTGTTGTGPYQRRTILGMAGAVATVDRNWDVIPDGTTPYTVLLANAAALSSTLGISGVVLASNGLDSIVIETGVNARQALSPILASAAGVLAGAGSTSITIGAGNNPATNRITASVDGVGNRTSVTLVIPA